MSEFTPFSLYVDYTDRDVCQAARYLQNRSMVFRYSWLFIPICVAFIIFLVINSMSYSTDQINYISVALISIVPAIVLCIAIIFSKRFVDPWFINRRTKKLRAIVPGFNETVQYNFTHDYVESSTSLSSSKSHWKLFTHVTESEHAVLFWAGQQLVFFIPNTALANANTDQQLRRLVADKRLIPTRHHETSPSKRS